MMGLITFIAALILRGAFKDRKKSKRNIVRVRAREQCVSIEQAPPDVVQGSESLLNRIRQWRPPTEKRFYVLALLIVMLIISIVLLIAMTGKARPRNRNKEVKAKNNSLLYIGQLKEPVSDTCCPEGWYRQKGYCYTQIKSDIWAVGVNACRNLGAELIMPKDVWRDNVVQMMNQGQNAWVGIKKHMLRNTYVWKDTHGNKYYP